ncbi:MAG: tetratricopeptide repeat protein [Acidobacteria bacterium]|nr:tetratricopeptide repeat protein [Acidobacteriota bacterium]
MPATSAPRNSQRTCFSLSSDPYIPNLCQNRHRLCSAGAGNRQHCRRRCIVKPRKARGLLIEFTDPFACTPNQYLIEKEPAFRYSSAKAYDERPLSRKGIPGMSEGAKKLLPKIADEPAKKGEAGFKALFTKLRKRRIIETLAAFIGGGWLLVEVVERLLVSHYKFPEEMIDLTVISIIGAFLATLVGRWFGGTEKRPGNIKVEVLLVPLIILATLCIDLIIFLEIIGNGGKALVIAAVAVCLGIAWIILKSLQWAAASPETSSGLTQNPTESPTPASTHAEKSIAVLPFKNISADPEQDYFCEGLAEELINVLTRVGNLRVVARTSAFSFQGKDADIREIGKKLNVENVLEGSVRKAGQKLRITAQLINVADGYHLWSERFDREMSDVFAIQDEIAQAVSAKMKAGLQDDRIEGVAKRYTENIEAYNLYLKGIYWRRMLTVDRVSKSIDFFNRAIEKDPGYALAFAGLAYAYLVQSFYSPTPPKDLFLKARQAALRALELDDGLPEAHEAMGIVKAYWEWDWEGAERELLRTLDLNPGYIWGHFHLANIRLSQGRLGEAIEIFRKIHFLDPLNVGFTRNLGECYLRFDRLKEAEEMFRDSIDIDPLLPMTWIFLGYVLLRQFRYEEAVTAMGKDSLKGSVPDLNIGIVYARMGKREEALRILNDWLGRSEKEFVSPYYIAMLCFALGKNDLGFQWLEKGYEEHDGWLMSLKVDFLTNDVRNDPRLSALLKKIGMNR